MKLSRIAASSLATITLLSTSCNSGHNEQQDNSADSATITDTSANGEDVAAEADYHADNDIAMMVRSLADAISVDEELNAADYEYRGVLTDGRGRPLYTSPTGAPGVWTVRVANGKAAEITPDMPGNIMQADLKAYIATALGLSDEKIVRKPELHNRNFDEYTVYKIDGGHLCFESATHSDSRGGEMVNIRILLIKE